MHSKGWRVLADVVVIPAVVALAAFGLMRSVKGPEPAPAVEADLMASTSSVATTSDPKPVEGIIATSALTVTTGSFAMSSGTTGSIAADVLARTGGGTAIGMDAPQDNGAVWMTDPTSKTVVFLIPSGKRDLLVMHQPRVPWRVCYGERCLPLQDITNYVIKNGEPRRP